MNTPRKRLTWHAMERRIERTLGDDQADRLRALGVEDREIVRRLPQHWIDLHTQDDKVDAALDRIGYGKGSQLDGVVIALLFPDGRAVIREDGNCVTWKPPRRRGRARERR